MMTCWPITVYLWYHYDIILYLLLMIHYFPIDDMMMKYLLVLMMMMTACVVDDIPSLHPPFCHVTCIPIIITFIQLIILLLWPILLLLFLFHSPVDTCCCCYFTFLHYLCPLYIVVSHIIIIIIIVSIDTCLCGPDVMTIPTAVFDVIDITYFPYSRGYYDDVCYSSWYCVTDDLFNAVILMIFDYLLCVCVCYWWCVIQCILCVVYYYLCVCVFCVCVCVDDDDAFVVPLHIRWWYYGATYFVCYCDVVVFVVGGTLLPTMHHDIRVTASSYRTCFLPSHPYRRTLIRTRTPCTTPHTPHPTRTTPHCQFVLWHPTLNGGRWCPRFYTLQFVVTCPLPRPHLRCCWNHYTTLALHHTTPDCLFLPPAEYRVPFVTTHLHLRCWWCARLYVHFTHAPMGLLPAYHGPFFTSPHCHRALLPHATATYLITWWTVLTAHYAHLPHTAPTYLLPSPLSRFTTPRRWSHTCAPLDYAFTPPPCLPAAYALQFGDSPTALHRYATRGRPRFTRYRTCCCIVVIVLLLSVHWC